MGAEMFLHYLVMDSLISPYLVIFIMNIAPLAFLLVMCGRKKKSADVASIVGPTPAGALPASDDRNFEEKKSKKETSKKSEKKSVKEKSKKEKSKKEKSKKESVKEGKSDKKDEAAKADTDKEKDKKESGDDEKEKKEGDEKEKKEGGDEKEKKDGDEAGGDKPLPKATDLQTADMPQQTAMQMLKKEMVIDPPDLHFSKDGGVVRMILTNNLGTRVAVKIKCSDNDLFRVNPVFTFIEKERKFVIEVSRNSGNPKTDKLAVVVLEVPDDVKDPQAVFKDAPADKLITSSVPMFTN